MIITQSIYVMMYQKKTTLSSEHFRGVTIKDHIKMDEVIGRMIAITTIVRTNHMMEYLNNAKHAKDGDAQNESARLLQKCTLLSISSKQIVVPQLN